MTKLIEQLNWRYATKPMKVEKIPDENLEAILEAIRLTASSSGYSHTKFMGPNEHWAKSI